MSLDSLMSAIPDYAQDLRRNLESVIGGSVLTSQQLWGTVLATAVASRSVVVLRELGPEARARLSGEAYTAAKSAAAVMAVSNVFFRTRHLLSDHAYGELRTGLRMNVLGDHRVDRVDFELWALAVSAVNACGACLDSHERVLRAAGVGREVVQEAFKVAAVMWGVGVVVEAEDVLGE